MGFLGPKTPSMPWNVPPPPAPTVAAPAVQAGGQALQDEMAARRGRASTLLTSGQGVLSAPPTLRKTLLG